ncbi:TolC family protein [Leptospira licerasiae]|uniref:Outer membrane efflux protein n=1 Tax=Leptospira licerasiae str. MMD4847 TaxID=1049971 RepID=A0ABP2RB45_9LEPT|nr:TolC family protein [Leptospira licerasiae]EID99733.1 outer membrane efflux protein [Leptospira licerasiae serovar Varillal str. VAR 010]EJZ41593.1 outer membrane efflux protein [Leptospira licerasiae str. MMD4847]
MKYVDTLNNYRKVILSCLACLLILECASSPEVKVADGVVEESLKNITGITTQDVEKTVAKETFGLDDLYILAVERTERIALKNEATEQALAQKDKAFAGFMPTLSYVFNKFYSVPGHTQQPSIIDNYKTYKAIQSGDPLSLLPSSSSGSNLPPTVGAGSRLLLSIPISAGLSSYQDYRASKSLAEQRRLEAKHEAGRMYLEIAQAYFNFLQLEESVKISQEAYELNQDSLQERKRMYAVGRIMRSDLLNSETSLSNAEAVLADAKFQLEQVRITLATMVGYEKPISVAGFKADLEPIPTGMEPEEYLAKRYDVLSAYQSVKVADAQKDKAWVGFAPTIALNNYYSFPYPGQTHSKDVTAQLQITMPLTPFSQMADLKAADSAKKQAKLTASQTRRTATQEIRNAFESFKNSQKILAIYQKAFTFAQETSQSQASGYRSGRNSRIEAIASRIAMLNAEITYRKMLHQHSLNRIALGVAIGEIPHLPGEKKEE